MQSHPTSGKHGGEHLSGPESPAQEFHADEFHKIPLIRIRKCPEKGLQLIETGQSVRATASTIREEYGVDPTLIRDFRVTGDSMSGTLEPGDRVRAVFRNCRASNDGTIYLLKGPTSLLLRRVRLRKDGVVLVADNPRVPNQKIDIEEWETDYEPIARVLEIHRSV